MKKSKLSLALVTAFIATLSLTSCDDYLVKDKREDKALITFTGYDGKEIEVMSTDFYSKYRDTADGIKKFYNQIMEVLIRYEFQSKSMDGKTAKTYAQIVSEAENSVKEDKDTAESNAKSNGTHYDDEWQTILDNKGVEDEKELKENYIFNLEKSEIQDWYFNKEVKDDLTSEFIGVKADGNIVESKVAPAMPYHIRHILVKVEDGGSNYSTGTISETQAKGLSNIVKSLLGQKETFGQIAYYMSEDSSNTAYGDVGIVTNKATSGSLSMVPEFQLGIYAYDAILRNNIDTTVAAEDYIVNSLGANGFFKNTGDTVADKLNEMGITEVPFRVFEELGQYADKTKDTAGNQLSEGSSKIYPRNILWNKYLNHHDVFVITNRKADTVATVGAETNEVFDYKVGTGTGVAYETVTAATDGKCGWREASQYGLEDDSGSRYVLTDEAGRIILGVRSEYGIHFIVMQKSMFDYADTSVSLNDYYTMDIPTDANKDTYPESTYVTYLSSSKSDYNERAETVRSTIKGFDATYDYRLFEFLTKDVDLKYNGEEGADLGVKINDYIERQRANNLYQQEKGINGVWESYIELLQAQYANRTEDRMVSEGCKVGFYQDLTDEQRKEYQEGGSCYYAN